MDGQDHMLWLFLSNGGLYTGWCLHFKMNGKWKIVFYLSSEVNIATISLLCYYGLDVLSMYVCSSGLKQL